MNDNVNSNKFYRETIKLLVGALVLQSTIDVAKAAILARLQAQGSATTIEVETSDLAPAGGIAFTSEIEWKAATEDNYYIAGQETGFGVFYADVGAFLSQRDAVLGNMAKNFINGLGNSMAEVANGNSGAAIDDEDGGSTAYFNAWINNFRDIFPRLEATNN